MFCTNCGSQLSDGLKFCIYCGTPLFEADPAANSAGPAPVFPGSAVAETAIPAQEETKKKGLLVLVDAKDSNKFYGCGLDHAVILGREAGGCDMVIQGDKSVSRKHCRFYRQGNSCYVEDLNSVNHTYLNGAIVEGSREIHVGDHLKFGMVEVVVAECELGS